ncbi:SPOR domain-containing protein [Phenylobacterium sp.]|uniref:cell division protein FtsN n=1 Tax=Phenylobacterium sp. TaxID=1871053 RepID=UPI003919C4A2
MSDHERGAYTPPTDAPLSFDARQPVRGARPIPITLIISVLVLAGLVAAIFVFYRSGVRQAGDAPQAVGAPVTGMKEAAPPEAQPQDPAAGLQIYRSDAPGAPVETTPQFTPGPEQPQPRPAPTTPVVVTQPAAPAAPPPQQVAAVPALRPALPAQAPAQPPPVQKTAPAPVAKAPAAPVPKAPEPKAPAPTAPAPKPAASGSVAVQVGAVSTPALADKTWSEAVAAAPGLAAGKGKSVEKIERNGATLYRTAVTGFDSREEASAFCARLKAAGKACFVR